MKLRGEVLIGRYAFNADGRIRRCDAVVMESADGGTEICRVQSDGHDVVVEQRNGRRRGRVLVLRNRHRDVDFFVARDLQRLSLRIARQQFCSANNPGLPHKAEGALARPSSSVRKAQFYSGKVLLIGKAQIDAHLTVPEL